MLVKLGPANLNDGEVRSFEHGDRYILVVKLGEQVHAINDLCNHAGCLLSGGWLEERAIVCPCHEYKFDVTTGENVTRPKLCDDQDRYVAQVEGGELFVQLPDEP